MTVGWMQKDSVPKVVATRRKWVRDQLSLYAEARRLEARRYNQPVAEVEQEIEAYAQTKYAELEAWEAAYEVE